MEDIHKKVVLQIRKEFVLLKKGWAQLKNYLGKKIEEDPAIVHSLK